MAKDYWQRIARRVQDFALSDDALTCRPLGRSREPMMCELCDPSPIYRMFLLENQRTSEQMIVGGNCALQYAQVHQKRYGDPLHLRVPAARKEEAERYLGGVPYVKLEFVEYMDDPAAPNRPEVDDEDDIQCLAPEGMGFDEIDWQSFNWDRD